MLLRLYVTPVSSHNAFSIIVSRRSLLESQKQKGLGVCSSDVKICTCSTVVVAYVLDCRRKIVRPLLSSFATCSTVVGWNNCGVQGRHPLAALQTNSQSCVRMWAHFFKTKLNIEILVHWCPSCSCSCYDQYSSNSNYIGYLQLLLYGSPISTINS